MLQNKQVILKKRPIGHPDKNTWSLESNPIPEPKEGEGRIEQHYISLDQAMRGWRNEGKADIERVDIDAVMRGGAMGQVIKRTKCK